jgi:hypothetical protein
VFLLTIAFQNTRLVTVFLLAITIQNNRLVTVAGAPKVGLPSKALWPCEEA